MSKRDSQQSSTTTTKKRTKITQDNDDDNDNEPNNEYPNGIIIPTNNNSDPDTTTTTISSIHIPANITALSTTWIGKAILTNDGSKNFKAAVMYAASASTTNIPKFSKYSGIQPFNNAILLFINADGCSYENMFKLLPNHGVRIAWFAQDRHTMETPIIQRLVTSTCDRIFLFVRNQGEPYLSCGELKLFEYKANTKPIRFEFDLVNGPTLSQTSTHFKRLFGLTT
jgi:hypothetical protein